MNIQITEKMKSKRIIFLIIGLGFTTPYFLHSQQFATDRIYLQSLQHAEIKLQAHLEKQREIRRKNSITSQEQYLQYQEDVQNRLQRALERQRLIEEKNRAELAKRLEMANQELARQGERLKRLKAISAQGNKVFLDKMKNVSQPLPKNSFDVYEKKSQQYAEYAAYQANIKKKTAILTENLRKAKLASEKTEAKKRKKEAKKKKERDQATEYHRVTKVQMKRKKANIRYNKYIDLTQNSKNQLKKNNEQSARNREKALKKASDEFARFAARKAKIEKKRREDYAKLQKKIQEDQNKRYLEYLEKIRKLRESSRKHYSSQADGTTNSQKKPK